MSSHDDNQKFFEHDRLFLLQAFEKCDYNWRLGTNAMVWNFNASTTSFKYDEVSIWFQIDVGVFARKFNIWLKDPYLIDAIQRDYSSQINVTDIVESESL